MYAVIQTGGKQYRVGRGDVIDVELQPVEGTKVGAPTVPGARVSGIVVDEMRGPKVRIFKKKKRKGYRRTNGHRQDYLRVRIQDIEL